MWLEKQTVQGLLGRQVNWVQRWWWWCWWRWWQLSPLECFLCGRYRSGSLTRHKLIPRIVKTPYKNVTNYLISQTAKLRHQAGYLTKVTQHTSVELRFQIRHSVWDVGLWTWFPFLHSLADKETCAVLVSVPISLFSFSSPKGKKEPSPPRQRAGSIQLNSVTLKSTTSDRQPLFHRGKFSVF